MLISNKVVTR